MAQLRLLDGLQEVLRFLHLINTNARGIRKDSDATRVFIGSTQKLPLAMRGSFLLSFNERRTLSLFHH